jgi:hypothetical protein
MGIIRLCMINKISYFIYHRQTKNGFGARRDFGLLKEGGSKTY